MRLLVALGPALLASTDGGLARLAAWDRELRPIEDDAYTYGDVEAAAAVRAALALVPAPVRCAVVAETAFLLVGLSSRAWTSSARFIDRDGRARSRVVILGPDANDVQSILHEVGHVWLAGPPDEISQAVSAQGEAAVYALATAQGWRRRGDELVARGERLADALALSWMYSTPEGQALPA